MKGTKNSGALKFWLVGGLVLLLLLGGCLLYILKGNAADSPASPLLPPPQEGALTVYMLDVGQGDALLLISPEGKTMLVDTGSADKEETLLGALQSLGIEKLDVLLLTHCHEDHAGGAANLVQKIKVGKVYFTGDLSAYSGNLEQILSRRRISAEALYAGMETSWSEECAIEVLSPFSDRFMGDENDGSAVVQVRFENSSLLLCADATVDTERLLLALYPLSALRCSAIKLGHHGSATSSSEAFLLAADPALALISVGASNDYGHPAPSVLDTLEALEIPYISTAEAGTVQIVLDGSGARVIK